MSATKQHTTAFNLNVAGAGSDVVSAPPLLPGDVVTGLTLVLNSNAALTLDDRIQVDLVLAQRPLTTLSGGSADDVQILLDTVRFVAEPILINASTQALRGRVLVTIPLLAYVDQVRRTPTIEVTSIDSSSFLGAAFMRVERPVRDDDFG